ncbi:MAG: hypothetical protein Q9183_002311 [Haloplaca sp. 2 TL-2023]
MSHDPSTPDKPGAEAPASSSSKGKESASGAENTRSSLHEPSPASTYGETAAGDSDPATPQAHGSQDDTPALLGSFRGIGLNDSVERGSGSPVPAPRQSKSRARVEQAPVAGHRHAVQAASSSSTQSDHGSSGSSVTGNRYNQIRQSPNWRDRSGVLGEPHRNGPDDPFVVAHNRAVFNESMNEGGFQPREDRVNLPLSADTAQAMLPPNACVFVANLAQALDDEELEKSVSEVFQAFGNVYVKIRRDTKGMPFAFCQYEHVRDAQRAITMGRGVVINERPCRTEVAKVNRSLYLSRVTGGPIDEDQARQILGRFGAIEKLWYCSDTDKEMFRLPEGVWVMFAFFQDCRDAQAGFRDDPNYRLEQPKMPEDMRQRLGVRSHAPTMPHRPRGSPARVGLSPQAVMMRTADLCDIFVGNLPFDATEDKLRELFGLYGRIANIEIIRKPSPNRMGANVFAFIRFWTMDEAERATWFPYQLGGHELRVEPRQSAEALARRDAPFAGGSPRTRVAARSSQQTMAMMFQQGVQIGMANATASQLPAVAAPMYPAYNATQSQGAATSMYPAYNATQSQAGAPPMYSTYNAFPQYGVPQYTSVTTPSRLAENQPSRTLQGHATPFVPQSLEQGMAPGFNHYEHMMQAHAGLNTSMNTTFAPQRTTHYQWPPLNNDHNAGTTTNAVNTNNGNTADNQDDEDSAPVPTITRQEFP